MRLTTETVIRGELMVLELSERDFCPECCGTLEIAGTEAKPFLRCLSCYLVLRPKTTKTEES
jgi:hypothetical protein